MSHLRGAWACPGQHLTKWMDCQLWPFSRWEATWGVSGPPEPSCPLWSLRPVSGMAEWMGSPLGTQAWPRQGDITHLLHTMAMTTTAMRKTRPAAEEANDERQLLLDACLVLGWRGSTAHCSQPGSGGHNPCIPTALALLASPDSLPLQTEHQAQRPSCYSLTSYLGQIHELLRRSTSHL